MRVFSGTVIEIARSLVSKRAATEQGGLLSGKDPTAFNPSDPLRLWIIQVGIIVLTTQLLALVLRKIRQPKVIAEVIGGIILGPTAFGRIPGFQQHIFPQQSQSYLSLVANIGLCLFLFLVGLEIDGAVIKRNARLSATIALAGMVIPFGLGAALSVPLYHQFIDQSVKFTNFMLFTGVAYSITAFPVLCRILTELKLLDTTVGIVVLSAGVGNDIVGWTLLALSVALVNAGSGLEALWILLTCVGWTLLLLFPVKYALLWLARRTGSISNGPTMFFMTATILILFGSAFMTDVIGVHAIFGAFLAGLIVPREGGLTIALTEKLEDMVSIIFLPLYFTLSGLSTDLGLLNDGITWAYVVAICTLAYSGKFGGCCLAARFAGFNWREASTIGSLMSCKGLVELIVLNVGLSAGILSQRVFSMFVLEALLLTFMTTPAVSLLYPPEKRMRVSTSGPNFSNVAEEQSVGSTRTAKSSGMDRFNMGHRKTRFTVVLDKIEHLPGMMALTHFMQTPPSAIDSTDVNTKRPRGDGDVYVDALRLIELSDRTSAVMKSSLWETLIHIDPLLGIFRTFGEVNGMAVSSSLSIVPYYDLGSTVAEVAERHNSELVLIPWNASSADASDDLHIASADTHTTAPTTSRLMVTSPFESIFRTGASSGDHSGASALHSHFVRDVFSKSTRDVALFVDQQKPGSIPRTSTGASGTGGRYHFFLPFIGGPDDRLAIRFVTQLCAHLRCSATIVWFTRRDGDVHVRASIDKPPSAYLGDDKGEVHVRENLLTVASAAFPDTVYGAATTQTRLQSETADKILWEQYTRASQSGTLDATTNEALSRMEFRNMATPKMLHSIIEHATALEDNTADRRSKLMIIVGRSRRLAVENHAVELKQLMEEHGSISSEVKKSMGDVAVSFVITSSKASIVVLQASETSNV